MKCRGRELVFRDPGICKGSIWFLIELKRLKTCTKAVESRLYGPSRT